MEYQFTQIEYDFSEKDNLILRAFADEVNVEYEIEEDWLREEYEQEFIETVYRQTKWDSPPEDIPTGNILDLHEWASEYLTKERMWYIWEMQPPDKMTIIHP